jgi:hypothetical protein
MRRGGIEMGWNGMSWTDCIGLLVVYCKEEEEGRESADRCFYPCRMQSSIRFFLADRSSHLLGIEAQKYERKRERERERLGAIDAKLIHL